MEKRNYCIFSETLKGRLTRSSRSHVMAWYFAAFKPRPKISTREALQILWALQPYQIYVISMILKCTICRMSGVIATTDIRVSLLLPERHWGGGEQCTAGAAPPAALVLSPARPLHCLQPPTTANHLATHMFTQHLLKYIVYLYISNIFTILFVNRQYIVPKALNY